MYGLFFPSAVFLFAVFAPVDLILLISEYEYVIQALLDGCDAARVFAADHIADLFGQFQIFLLDDLLIFDNVDRDVVIDKSEYVEIHEINGTFDLDDILSSHFVALSVLDDRHAAVQFIKVQIFVDIHTLSGLDVVEHETFGDASYIQCIFYHSSFLSLYQNPVVAVNYQTGCQSTWMSRSVRISAMRTYTPHCA